MIRASVEDAERINDWVWRDSGVKPDFTQFLSDRMNVALLEGEGGALFVWRGPAIYEVHVFFEQRGKEVIRLSRAMLRHMRSEYGATLFWAAVPYDETKLSRKVRLFTRLMGWKSQGHADLSHGRCELFTGE
ncbi:MAG: hypothetical protein JWR80_9492 [Bradyrhizobium sp.]|nr:hypothetical protein [Bradyrhizobium sp.]